MRIEDVTVALRPRSSWEAVELGTALVRRHARAIWRPWFAVTLPAFVALNVLFAVLGVPALAALAMWWLKPLFDRLPLFVLSRAVFGEVPDTRTTLRGAFRGAGRAMLGYLTWRRLSPARALLMPVDVLEGGPAAQAAARRRVLGGPAYGVAAMCLAAFLHFEVAVTFGLASLVFVFIPNEYLRTSLLLIWEHLREAPPWLVLIENVLAWTATSLLEPFYVGSGFGQYLNRRTEIEGWDIELALRRLRARLLEVAAPLAIMVACLLAAPAQAAEAMPRCALPVHDTGALQRAFGPDYRDSAGFRRSVDAAFEDARLHPQKTVMRWVPKKPRPEARERPLPAWLKNVGAMIATLGEVALWALAAGLVLLLVLTAKRWWPWLRSVAQVSRPAAAPVEQPDPTPEPLPADITRNVRRLWQAGRPRDALALLYRAAVEAMLAATGRVLPPGATEAQCLRASQALPEAPRRAFARVVRLWQYAAYAERLPSDDEFDAALGEAAQQFGWRA